MANAAATQDKKVTTTKCSVIGLDNIPSGDKIIHLKNESGRDVRVRMEKKVAHQFSLGLKVNLTLEEGVPVYVNLAKIKSIIEDKTPRKELKATSLEEYIEAGN